MAQQFDVVTALYFTFPPSYVAAMKAVNPNLVVLVYVNGALAQATQGPTSNTGYPVGDYLLDATQPGPIDHVWQLLDGRVASRLDRPGGPTMRKLPRCESLRRMFDRRPR